MPEKGTEIAVKCEFIRLLYRAQDSDFKVMQVKVLDVYTPCPREVQKGGRIVCVGECPDDYIEMKALLRVEGLWVNTKYGKQLKISSVAAILPQTKTGIYQFLSSGVIKGIGTQIAHRLVEKFGENTLKVMDENPEKILEIKGIGEKKAQKIAKSWKEQRAMAELLTNLCGMGLSLAYARRVQRAFGSDAMQIIEENPYRLTEVSGIGFLKADEIARKRGVEPDSPNRIRAAIRYIVETATYNAGHCYLPVQTVLSKANEFGISNQMAMKEIDKADIEGLYFNDVGIYLEHIYRAERYVAGRLNEMAYEGGGECDFNGDGFLTEEQTRAVASALKRRLVCITGLPGTGKTTSIKALIREIERRGEMYVLTAPTGKAAKRLSEQTERDAMTIHRLLGCSRTGVFERNEQNPLYADYVIVDEVSMVDISLFEGLLRAVQGNTRVVLIGDYNQLPSVGPGSVLRDIVDGSLCHVERLTRIQRQAETSTIVRIAHEINRGNRPSVHRADDYEFIPQDDPNEIYAEILKLIKKYGPETVQVLSPMNKGQIGVSNLNAGIRDLIYGTKSKQNRFLEKDKVIQRVNNYDKQVFNGEIGVVTNIDEDEQTVTVLFDDREVVYEDYELDELSPAYALTIHRSQGSEYDFVVMPVSTHHYIMLYRNLLYTGVTRAKKRLVLIGSERALNIAIKNNKPVKRYTTLGALK
ncbi:MAG: ATP-dependent RecD-like DNA helicase [Nitrospirae bacterium]|nr:MAG: ATP-dependent RecD-like DNA helicase [Nitrospirota bacterium]